MPKINIIKQLAQINQIVNEAAQSVEKGCYKRAGLLLEKALRLDYQFANALYLYSICLQKFGKEEEASQYRRKAWQLNPYFLQYFKISQKEGCKKIKQLYNQCKQMYKELSVEKKTWVNLVSSSSKCNDYNACYKIMEIFMKVKKPNNSYPPHTFSTFGIHYYQIGQYQQSLSLYSIAISLSDEEFRYFNNSAILQYILGNFEESERLVFRSLEMKPGYAKSLFILSFSLAKMGRIDQSLDKIKQASEKTKSSLLYRFKIITNLLLYREEFKAEAEKQLDEVIKNITEDKDEDTYFFSKQNKPLLTSAASFLLQNLRKQQIDRQLWREYVSLFDDYLIKGHHDKYRITIKMEQLCQKMSNNKVTNEFSLPDDIFQQIMKATST